MKIWRTDLHVHTVLSPCAEVEMIPPFIVQEAIERGIQLIAITDHNATANISAVQKAAAGSGLVVLPGMELQTREDVHVLCLFDNLEQTLAFQSLVDSHLPDMLNEAEHFGEQFVVDENGEFIRREERLLLTSVSFSLEEAFTEVENLGGLFIPAHINRTANGLIANLGLVPTDINIPALEISRHLRPSQVLQKYPQVRGYPLIQSGDVHRLEEFLGSTELTLEEPSIAELRLALKNALGRSVTICE